VSCGIPVQTALHDLSAIHYASDWSPRTPALMLTSPDGYLHGGDPLDAAQSFEVHDHLAVESAILTQLANTDPADPGMALETTAWLLLELHFDSAPSARIHSLAILSHFLGQWVTHENARLLPTKSDASLESALAALTASHDRVTFLEGVRRLRDAPFPDPVVAARSLIGLGRRAHLYKLDAASRTQVFDVAVQVVMLHFEQASRDADADVAQNAAERIELIRPFATNPR